MTDREAFEKWLNTLYAGKTYKDWIEYWQSNVRDIEWAFSAGYNKGLLKGLEEGSK